MSIMDHVFWYYEFMIKQLLSLYIMSLCYYIIIYHWYDHTTYAIGIMHYHYIFC